MALPAADQIGAALDVFKPARAASLAALVETDLTREEAQKLYAEARSLAVDLCDTVEYYYRADKSPSSRRAKCRRWGVVYVYGKGERSDPQDETGAV